MRLVRYTATRKQGCGKKPIPAGLSFTLSVNSSSPVTKTNGGGWPEVSKYLNEHGYDRIMNLNDFLVEDLGAI